YAAREGRHSWPHADGVIQTNISGANARAYSIALEFKRPNEGLHGVLTAIGQAHAYLRKGYAGAVIVIPQNYNGFTGAGDYVRDVLDLTSKNLAIGVYGYRPPDLTKTSPFAGRLIQARALAVDAAPAIAAPMPPQVTETQWAHVREGSTDPDAFFRYLQAVKLFSGDETPAVDVQITNDLAVAIQSARPGVDPIRYLSNAMGDSMPDRAWRYFWFKYILFNDNIAGWQLQNGILTPNSRAAKIRRSDNGAFKYFFAGKSNSVRNKLVLEINSGQTTVAEANEVLVRNYFSRAHSYREDVDSGVEHLGFVDQEGRLTDAGYRFVDACERTGDANTGVPLSIFVNAALTEGGLGAFLHYVYKLSDEAFSSDPLRFTHKNGNQLIFDSSAYLIWLEKELVDRLRVMRKVSARGGVARKPFQAELAVLRGLGIVRKGFRVGVGLVINWPELHEALEAPGGFASASQ
ncbi:hypothetical protein, partial [Sphingorhabdus sp.]|uniref:hypothetical protein n=1 Tax=Sphingorhabdus sp. TaxID=1902408 RepID=UPI00391CB676